MLRPIETPTREIKKLDGLWAFSLIAKTVELISVGGKRHKKAGQITLQF